MGQEERDLWQRVFTVYGDKIRAAKAAAEATPLCADCVSWGPGGEDYQDGVCLFKQADMRGTSPPCEDLILWSAEVKTVEHSTEGYRLIRTCGGGALGFPPGAPIKCRTCSFWALPEGDNPKGLCRHFRYSTQGDALGCTTAYVRKGLPESNKGYYIHEVSPMKELMIRQMLNVGVIPCGPDDSQVVPKVEDEGRLCDCPRELVFNEGCKCGGK